MPEKLIKKGQKNSKKSTYRHTKKPASKNKISKKKVKKKKLAVSFVLNKSKNNPIISPKPENIWETWQTFNPTVILLNNKVHFLYRAIGEDGISRLGYAVSNDGFNIDERLPYPVYEHQIKEKIFDVISYCSGGSWGGAEDPRIVRVDKENILYMTYTACDNGLQVGLSAIEVNDFLNKKWKWKPSTLISSPNEVHKNWVIFPEKINGKYAILHSIKPHIQIEYRDDLKFNRSDYINSFYGGGPQKGCWDKWVRGVGAVPIKTKDGWLVFYHAMDNDWSKYKVGAMLLDINDPTKILYRSKKPILEPNEYYENNGSKRGVVYASGAVIKEEDLLIYYGAADSYICVAYSNLNKFLEALKKEVKPKLKRKIIRKK